MKSHAQATLHLCGVDWAGRALNDPGMTRPRFRFSAFWLMMLLPCLQLPVALRAATPGWSAPAGLRIEPQGIVRARVAANIESWLLPAPESNPGMLGMFRVRDREPKPNLVPWAGEFVGKYLISAIQTLALADSPALRTRVEGVLAELLASQAEDGYLGPFPKAERLRGHWDLWGHYHVMQALLLWHEATGDMAVLKACERAGELVCRTYLDGTARVFDAGSPEMNMAIIHVLGQLHRVTREPRLAQLMVEIEKDWERAGDYFRMGLRGREFYATPLPRWESLHDVQGLLELGRLTGDSRYAEAFENLWRSIAKWDRHNAGSFTTGEQATGNPYADGAIETCCTVAWMALTADMLRLRGSSRVADELELSFFNGGLGAQHPSGRWWTYSTPMDGVREASAHSIVFQARAGTPELNCCSVNGPRVLSMLRDWALLSSREGLMLNHLGPARYSGQWEGKGPFAFEVSGAYPRGPEIELRVEEAPPGLNRVLIRIPAWSRRTTVAVNGLPVAEPAPGRHLALERQWIKGDRVAIHFDFGLRAEAGDREALGKVSIYRGPLLLAWDQRWNDHDESGIPAVAVSKLSMAGVRNLPTGKEEAAAPPWVLVDVPAEGGRRVMLSDYANAGSTGTRYRSWLAASDPLPPPPIARQPADGKPIPPGAVVFRWTGPRTTNQQVSSWRFWIADDPEGHNRILERGGLQTPSVEIDGAAMARLELGRVHYWAASSLNSHGQSEHLGLPSRFLVDPTLPPPEEISAAAGARLLIVSDMLLGKPNPRPGHLMEALSRYDHTPFAGLNGVDQRVVYQVPEFPADAYTASLWLRVEAFPDKRLGQVISAWCRPMDDPLRLCVDGGKLFARIESGGGYSTPGFPIQPGRRHHVAVVKDAGELRLHVDGELVASAVVPETLQTVSGALGIGGNPLYSGSEYLRMEAADFQFWSGALPPDEIADMASKPSGAARGWEPPR